MLRVRPIHYTSRMDSFKSLFTALGLTIAADHDSWVEFDAGSGRLGLHWAEPGSAEDGTSSLGFEVRDLDEFIRRTVEAGTTVEIHEAGHGTAARITAGDGTVFLADAAGHASEAANGTGASASASASDSDTGAGTGAPGDPDPALSVLPLWMTPDVGSARKVLGDIGARPRIVSDSGAWADFTAKNGGLVAVHHGENPGVGLSFEYDGELEVLQRRLAGSDIDAKIIDENFGRSLRLPNPDGRDEIWVNQKQSDLHGYTRAE